MLEPCGGVEASSIKSEPNLPNHAQSAVGDVGFFETSRLKEKAKSVARVLRKRVSRAELINQDPVLATA